jgi:hypothetical protein
MTRLHDMVVMSMIDLAGSRAQFSPSGAPLSPSRGTLAGAAHDLAAHHAVGLPGGAEPGSGLGGRGKGGGADFAAWPRAWSNRGSVER